MRRTDSIPFLWLISLLSALPFTAAGSKPRLHLERLDASALNKEELRLYVTAVELEGAVVDGLGAGQFTLLVDGKPAGRATRAQSFEALGEELDVAFVVEVSTQYKKDLAALKDALKEMLEDSPRRMRAMLIPFSSDFEPGTGFQPAAALTDQVDDLSPDDDSVDLRMADAVGAALTELKKLELKAPGDEEKATPRRVIVLISDGLNSKMDRPLFKALGDRAAKAGVPIHSIAFTPTDERGPLLNLGELSKRSNGTFRWANKAADLKAQLQSLGEELKKQYVLTFKSPVRSTGQHLFALRMEDLESNALGAGAGGLTRGKESLTARLGIWLYVLWGDGALLVFIFLALVIRARATAIPATTKRQKSAPPASALMKPTQRVKPISATQPSRTVPPVKQAAAAAGGQAVGGLGAATLVGIGGALGGTRLAVRGVMTIGKAPGLTITVDDDPSVSGRHAEIGSDGQGLYVKDLGSTNGTFVNNQRVSGLHRLRDGDIVRFGASTQFKARVD